MCRGSQKQGILCCSIVSAPTGSVVCTNHERKKCNGQLYMKTAGQNGSTQGRQRQLQFVHRVGSRHGRRLVSIDVASSVCVIVGTGSAFQFHGVTVGGHCRGRRRRATTRYRRVTACGSDRRRRHDPHALRARAFGRNRTYLRLQLHANATTATNPKSRAAATSLRDGITGNTLNRHN